MTKQSDFRADRDWSYDPPPLDDAPMSEKIRFQRRLRERREAAELPSDLPHVALNETRWWMTCAGIPPEQQRKQLERALKRERQDT